MPGTTNGKPAVLIGVSMDYITQEETPVFAAEEEAECESL